MAVYLDLSIHPALPICGFFSLFLLDLVEKFAKGFCEKQDTPFENRTFMV